MDVMTPNQRYKAMVHNRGRTRPERLLASALWHIGLRYFTHKGYKAISGINILGSPDLVFSKRKILVFVDGCFWHGCAECKKMPNQMSQFWLDKIANNRKRDQQVTSELISQGWTVLRIPEHAIRNRPALEQTLDWLLPILRLQPPGSAISLAGAPS